MQISELREEVGVALREFAWDQWAQMGVFASTHSQDRWATDPESLLLLTLELGRDEPRLFDEVLDWLRANEGLISTQRLRNLVRNEEDRMLAEGALSWLSNWGSRAGSREPTKVSTAQEQTAQPLFRGVTIPVTDAEPAFLQQGLLKPHVEPSRKAQSPDFELPINFAFRLRQVLGIGARSEVVRVLLCTTESRLSTQLIASSAGYSKRNVQEALTALHNARVVDVTTIGNELRFAALRDRWAALFGLTEEILPDGRDWPHLFHLLATLWRWLNNPANQELSGYMLASEARQLFEQLTPELGFIGMGRLDAKATGEEYWSEFVDFSRAVLRQLK